MSASAPGDLDESGYQATSTISSIRATERPRASIGFHFQRSRRVSKQYGDDELHGLKDKCEVKAKATKSVAGRSHKEHQHQTLLGRFNEHHGDGR
ncbi:hypothetical protein LTR82_010448, partial [Friedmanniomyces endolithicus]